MNIYFCLLVLLPITIAQPVDYYDTGNNNIDIDILAANRDFMTITLNCLVDKGTCDPQMQLYKDNMKDSIDTLCTRCTDVHKHLWNRFLAIVPIDYTTQYSEFQKVYDPTGTKLDELKKVVKDY
ncbi:unnamed protein product [Leptidea sinapis]|uniref:Uncharacterized protein n=1 Tax=Leptidea sinapis TaxID=189913 RepID=A0A5E4QXX6_9NEOP|nr:unnamed protein product [Leptidea sinapis]